MCYFCRKYITFEPKMAEKLYVITLKNDPKFEEELTRALKNEMRNLTNFLPTLESIKIDLCVMTLKGDAIFKEKLV